MGLIRELDSDYYIRYAREQGVEIGEGTQFFGEKKLDLGLGPMITIGKNCKITDGVRVLAHSGDYEILKRKYGRNGPDMPVTAPVEIGDNVFIGEQSIILPGVKIGNNTVVGAGSVVTSDIPSEVVAVGNPCKVVKSAKELNEEERTNQVENIRTYVRRHFERQEDMGIDNVIEFVQKNTEYETLEEFAYDEPE